MTIAGVADTHAALWHLFDDARLATAAGAFINEAATARRKIAISTISLAEVVYLIEKNRLPLSAYDELTQAPIPFIYAACGRGLAPHLTQVSTSLVEGGLKSAAGSSPPHRAAETVQDLIILDQLTEQY